MKDGYRAILAFSLSTDDKKIARASLEYHNRLYCSFQFD